MSADGDAKRQFGLVGCSNHAQVQVLALECSWGLSLAIQQAGILASMLFIFVASVSFLRFEAATGFTDTDQVLSDLLRGLETRVINKVTLPIATYSCL